MKKLLFLPLLFFIISCNPSEVTEKIKAPDAATNDVAMNYVRIANMHQAWTESYVHLLYWVNTPGESEEKKKLSKFVNEVYPEMRTELKKMEADSSLSGRIKDLEGEMEELIISYKNIMQTLSAFDEYENPTNRFLIESDVFDADGECHLRFNQLNTRFSDLKEAFRGRLKAK